MERKTAGDWKQAKERFPEANLAVISLHGKEAAREAHRALDEGLHVFLSSRSMPLEEEAVLKKKAHEKGLLVMGPDCGTAILQGTPIAFANRLPGGRIGIIGASGTGIQELTAMIQRMGEGVTNAIGTGGRDLFAEVGGITMLDAIDAMESDPGVKAVIVISKPPAREVRDKIVARLSVYRKPVVTVFLGERPEVHNKGFYHAYTLDEAAQLAVRLVREEPPVAAERFRPRVSAPFWRQEEKTIRAFYSGATLANEAAMLIRDTLELPVTFGRTKGYILNCEGHQVVDMGDELYTGGKNHPKWDPAMRIAAMEKAFADPDTGVILFDLVLGCCAHENMAGALLPVIQKLQAEAAGRLRKLFFVTSICGTTLDPQNYEAQKKLLTDAGVLVCESNKKAVETALFCLGYVYRERKKEVLELQKRDPVERRVPEAIQELLGTRPRILYMGSAWILENLRRAGCRVLELERRP